MDKQHQFDTQPPIRGEESSLPPKDWYRNQENGLNNSTGLVEFPEVIEHQTHPLAHLLGYILLMFALIDYIHILIPPHFTNFFWEFQMIGSLVEHVPIPLMGLVFVFCRNPSYIGKLENHFLWFLSWVSLVVGLVYLLMIPLGVTDTWRIYYASKAQITNQIYQQSQSFEQIKDQLSQATTDEQFKKLAVDLNLQSSSLQVKNTQAFKDQLRNGIAQAERSIQVQAHIAQTNETQALIKDSLKWNVGALIAGTSFILIWRLSGWRRIKI